MPPVAAGADARELVGVLRHFGELAIDVDTAEIVGVDVRRPTIDRRLAMSEQVSPQGRVCTKPGSLLKVRFRCAPGLTGDRCRPGFVESTWSATTAAPGWAHRSR